MTRIIIGAIANILLSAGAAYALHSNIDPLQVQPSDRCNTALAIIEYEAKHVQNAIVYRDGETVGILYGEEYSELKCNGGLLVVIRNH